MVGRALADDRQLPWPSAPRLNDELDELGGSVQRFLADLGESIDDVEIWLTRACTYGYIFHHERLSTSMDAGRDRVGFRVLKDGKVGLASTTHTHPKSWRAAVGRALETAREARAPKLLPPPRSRRPAPLTFDPTLANALAAPRELHRIATAIRDNTFHEAERIPGLDSFAGHLAFTVHHRVVGTRRGVQGSLHGHLGARVSFNGAYGDELHHVHAPESFLPLALLGARTWRNMPTRRATRDNFKLRGRVPVILHPRLVEALMRRFCGTLLTSSAQRTGLLPFKEGDRVASDAVTLIDDSTLDGLAPSRPFDDEGTPTQRNPLIIRGKLTTVLRTRSEAGGTKKPTGSAYRLPLAAGSPEDAPLRASVGSLLMERGEAAFHELLGAVDKAILVYDLLGLHSADLARSRFSCAVASGVSLERGRESRLLEPGQWSLSGTWFSLPGGPRGCLEEMVLSREVYDTGSAILPYCLTFLEV